MPCDASTRRIAPSHAASERETSYEKSTWPGVSIMLSAYARLWPEASSTCHGMRTAWLLIVIPRSRSMSMRSRYCARMSRSATTPVSCSIRSASVDLPWSIWAMMQKFRICAGAVKVLSAKLLMGISWWTGEYALPGYRARAVATQSRALAVPYARKYGSAVEDVSALRGEPCLQRGTEVHPPTAAVRRRDAQHPAGHQVRYRRHHRHAERRGP